MSNLSGVVREGWLKRVKNQKKRYFVLGFNKETGAAQLQYYENPKKFSSETVPKRVISLQHCLGIIKKVDEKFGHILVLYTKEAVFRLTAENDDLLDDWLKDLNKLHQMEYKNLQELKYDIVWNVKVIPRGLGGLKNVTGSYQLCLKGTTLSFVNPVTQEVVIEEKLYHVRKFGYWEYCVFMEFGRSTSLGAGEIWMEVEDPLIAQKIEDSLSRSVKPKSCRPERKSMSDSSWNQINQQSINNNDSPKPRRPTFIENLRGKKKEKDGLRQHANSISGTPTGSVEERITINRNASFTPSVTSHGDDEDSEERLYPKITPPLPSVGRTKSQSSGGSSTEEVILKPRKKISLDLDTKSESNRTEPNNYANILRPRRRSERKQDINVVRQNFAEQYQSSSLPRRTSSSSSSEPSWRRSLGSDNFGSIKCEDSDRDSPRDSDREEGESAFFQQNTNQYLKMNPRSKPIGSDSSADEPGASEPGVYDPGTYIALKPQSGTPDLYVQMNRHSPNLEKSRNTSSRSSGSYNSPEEGSGEQGPGVSTYVNMKPGDIRVTSSSSSEDFPTTTDMGDERFDHLNRDNYVNIGPQSPTRGLKKSNSQVQRGSDSAYVNVDMNHSESVGSKSRRFRIVSDHTSPEKDDESRELPSNYVNVKANGADRSVDSDGNYANFVPANQKENTEKSAVKKSRELNYASVEFFKNSPPKEKGSPRKEKNRQQNYSKIDFEKSNVLADISSTRERQLHHS